MNKVHTEFWWGNLREKDQLVDPGIDGRIITNHKVVWGMAWIYLAQDVNRW
jgi:hypothetical protein